MHAREYIYLFLLLIYTGSESPTKRNRENVYILVYVSSFSSCIRQLKKKLLYVLEYCRAMLSFTYYIISVNNSILLHLILHIIIWVKMFRFHYTPMKAQKLIPYGSMDFVLVGFRLPLLGLGCHVWPKKVTPFYYYYYYFWIKDVIRSQKTNNNLIQIRFWGK